MKNYLGEAVSAALKPGEWMALLIEAPPLALIIMERAGDPGRFSRALLVHGKRRVYCDAPMTPGDMRALAAALSVAARPVTDRYGEKSVTFFSTPQGQVWLQVTSAFRRPPEFKADNPRRVTITCLDGQEPAVHLSHPMTGATGSRPEMYRGELAVLAFRASVLAEWARAGEQ